MPRRSCRQAQRSDERPSGATPLGAASAITILDKGSRSWGGSARYMPQIATRAEALGDRRVFENGEIKLPEIGPGESFGLRCQSAVLDTSIG